jgi:alpha-galactosidase
MPTGVAGVLTNRDVIAVDQDSLGIQGFQHSARDSVEVWFKPLARGEWAMVILNRAQSARDVRFDWPREAVSDSLSSRNASFGSATYRVRDLWTKRVLGTTKRPLAARVPGRDVLMLRLQPQAVGGGR